MLYFTFTDYVDMCLLSPGKNLILRSGTFRKQTTANRQNDSKYFKRHPFYFQMNESEQHVNSHNTQVTVSRY